MLCYQQFLDEISICFVRFSNHGNSKKHKENVAQLRAHLQEEDLELGDLDAGIDPNQLLAEPVRLATDLTQNKQK